MARRFSTGRKLKWKLLSRPSLTSANGLLRGVLSARYPSMVHGSFSWTTTTKWHCVLKLCTLRVTERLRKHLAANGKKVSPSNVSSSFYLVSAPKLTWLCRRKISSRVGLFERADTCRPVCFDLDLDDWDAGVSHLDMIRVFEEHSIPFFNPHLIDLCDLDELEEQATPFYKQKCRSDSMSSLHNAERRSCQRSVEVSLT
jgi:hypothetical protein